MRICDNGTYRDMTAEELAAWEQEKANSNQDPTSEERIAALEEELKVAKILLGLEE